MPYEIIWSDTALGQMKKLERPVAKRIFLAVSRLEDVPGRLVTRIVNSPHYRMRVGDYRVILDIEDDRFRVLILKVGHRKKIYK